MYQRYLRGEPSMGVHLHTRTEKIGVFLHVLGAKGAENVFFFAALRATQKIFEHFL